MKNTSNCPPWYDSLTKAERGEFFVSPRFTACLNVGKASDQTGGVKSANWATFRVWEGMFFMLTNNGGNGQVYTPVSDFEGKTTLDKSEYAFHCLELVAAALGLSWGKSYGASKVWRIKKGSKITAAPSLLAGRVSRPRGYPLAQLRYWASFDQSTLPVAWATAVAKYNAWLAYEGKPTLGGL